MRPVPGCLSAHSRPPRHCLAIRPRNCGPDLLYLHVRLFLHLHLWPCFQPLVGLSVWLVWPDCLDLDALAAGRLVRLGCWIVSFIEPLLHQTRPLGRIFSEGASQLAPASCMAYVIIVLPRSECLPPTRSPGPKHPTHF